MSEVIFRCPCPASGCNDHTSRNWYHCDCPSSSKYYLSENGFLRCDNCNQTFPLFSCRWKSNSCSHDYRRTDWHRIIFCISIMCKEQNLSRNMMNKLMKSLMEQNLDD